MSPDHKLSSIQVSVLVPVVFPAGIVIVLEDKE
jgi:hypothetical protein